jgi:predicted transcriptional regulator
MPRRKKATQELSPLELDVMNVIWELGECTSARVIVEFQKRRSLANTTIRTVMSNIRRKGYIEMVPSVGSRSLFRATVSKESVARRALGRLTEALFDGSPAKTIAFMLEDGTFDASEAVEVRRLLDSRAGKSEM